LRHDPRDPSKASQHQMLYLLREPENLHSQSMVSIQLNHDIAQALSEISPN